MDETKDHKAAVIAVIASLKLTIEARFIPWSKSRNKGEKSPSLNWSVDLLRDGRKVLTTDYSAGCAHCSGYSQFASGGMVTGDWNAVKQECERGRTSMLLSKPLLPDTADFLYSLTQDASVLDAGTFADWCAELGYSDDSMKAKAIYDACIAHALALRSAVGESGLEALRGAYADY